MPRTRRTAAKWGLLPTVLMAVLPVGACQQPGQPLPPLEAQIEQTSVSGLSSGAYMAGQFQMAHSRIVTGAAIIAGGPYGCAESLYADAMPGPGTAILNLSKAANGCMQNGLQILGVPNPRRLGERARGLAAQGRIDPLASVAEDRIYLFAGKEDHTVVPAIVTAAAEFYVAIGVAPSRIKYVANVSAGHAFVTENKGLACGQTAAPYIVDCDYDQAGELLRHIYGELAPKAAAPAGQLLVFDQSEFTRDLGDHGMSTLGAVYVPAECADGGGCRVHIAFHGCSQNRAAVGEAFTTGAGFAAWAGTNRLVILFPQAAHSPANPQGCWDWWGYTGRDFLTKSAPQIVAVRRMLERLAGKRAMS
jgi:poly(3-hydroxybutyrate) depolymerase